MTLSTTSSIKPLQTLKGIFNAPKMNHRRDFLRENKLSLRELQRVTSRKQTTQQQEQQQKLQRQQDQHQQQQQNYARRRSASQQRVPQQQQTQQQQRLPERSISQQRKNYSTGAQQKTAPVVNSSSRCSSCGCSGHGANDPVDNRAAKLATNASGGSLTAKISKTKSCHKEIQTDDILDEKFLYNALKKCSSEYSIVAAANTKERATRSDPNVPTNYRVDHKEYDAQSYYDDEMQQQQQTGMELNARYSHQQHEQPQNPYTQYSPHQLHYNDEDNLPLDTARSRASHMTDAHSLISNTACTHTSHVNNAYSNQKVDSTRTHTSHATNEHTKSRLEEDLNGNLTNINVVHQAEQPLSGRSRQTVYSLQSQGTVLSKKRSTGSLHKLGSRDEIRLPRYLEREKREKEEQQAREMERDPNCPPGHYVLPEQERITALTGAEKKYKMLVQELNRMPMTTETLRIRTRKAEIEKELTVLEADIRIFSKPKVYLKETE